MGIINIASEQAIQREVLGLNKNLRYLNKREGNLFDKSKELNDYALGNTGGLSATSGYSVSDFIPVDSRVYPTLAFKSRNGVTETTTPYRAAFYDADHTFIGLATFNSAGKTTIPENAAYFRFSYSAQKERHHDAILYYAPPVFSLSWLDVLYKEGVVKERKNLFSRDEIIAGMTCNYGGGTFSVNLSATGYNGCTGFVRVEPYMEYVTSDFYFEQNSNSAIYEFGNNKNFLRIVFPYGSIYKASSDCHYIARNYVAGNVDFRDKPFFLYRKADFDFQIGGLIVENEDLTVRKTDALVEENTDYCRRIVGLYEEHAVVQRATGNSLYYSNTGVNGSFTEVPLTSFPGLLEGSLVDSVVFFTTNSGIRCLVFFTSNQLYCSTTGPFSGFEVPDIWDLKGNKSWRVSDSDMDPTGQRYRKHYPANVAQRQNPFKWQNGPVWVDGIGGQFARGLIFANYTNAYGNIPTPSCLFYTEDGKNIYVQYEFGVYQKKYKLAGDETEKSSVNYGYGDEVTPSSMSGGITSVTLKKRWNILPTEETPHPVALFDYSSQVTVSSVSGDQFVLADASGISVGDTVILEGTATDDFAKLLTTEVDGTTKVGNGPVFTVKAKSGNSITLADAIGNPKNNLMCRHIHGVTVFGQGLCIYTGEEYPESWFIYIAPVTGQANDGISMNDERWQTSVVRLNSSKYAFQRALGIYLRPDGKVVYAADTDAPFIKKAEALGKDIKMGGHGIFVTTIDGIDNPTGNLSKIDAVNDIYVLYKVGQYLLISDYRGYTYYSKDEGDTWKYICKDNTLKTGFIGFDRNKRRFLFNGARGVQFVVEVK